jgi:hypothetical protein
MFAFPQNVNQASSKTNTSFYILHLSSTELAIQIFPLLHILSLCKELMMLDYYKTFVTFFSMTHVYFAKILQMNTLCSMDNTSDHHQSSLHNTQTREDTLHQMTQFMTYLLWLGSCFLVFREMIINTLYFNKRAEAEETPPRKNATF